MKSINISRFAVLSALVILAAMSRLLPHPPNFAPIAAIALFGGVYFQNRITAFIVPALAMLLSDFIIGFHGLMFEVYTCFAITTILGFTLQNRVRPINIGVASLASSTLFFLVTNFAVWLGSTYYPQTSEGLLGCYVSAIPFFGYSIAGDLFYNSVLFGGFYLLQRSVSVLRVA